VSTGTGGFSRSLDHATALLPARFDFDLLFGQPSGFPDLARGERFFATLGAMLLIIGILHQAHDMFDGLRARPGQNAIELELNTGAERGAKIFPKLIALGSLSQIDGYDAESLEAFQDRIGNFVDGGNRQAPERIKLLWHVNNAPDQSQIAMQ